MKNKSICEILKALGLMVFVSALFSGCAFGNRKIDLVYPPQDYKQYAHDSAISKKIGIQKIALEVIDQRSGDLKYLGEVRNGFYMHTADVVTEQSVQAWVQKAFTIELQRSGFAVVSKDQAQAILKVTIDMVHCNAYWGYSADMMLRLSFVKGPKMGQVTKIEGFGSAGMNWGATNASYTESLAKALADSYYKAGNAFFSSASVVP